MKPIHAILVFLLSTPCWGQSLYHQLYIQRGHLNLIDSSQVDYISFRSAPNDSVHNPIIEANLGDTLNLWVYNQDSTAHDFVITGLTSPQTIAANDSANIVFHLNNAGVYIYQDPNTATHASYMGLSGMLVVKQHLHASFYWNLREIDPQWNQTISQNGTVNLGSYDPTFFLINERSAPQIDADSRSRVTGHVGDTLIIYIANQGIGIHSLHFHGYHCRVLSSSKNPQHLNWYKDTFPVYGGETLILELVPHQPGIYPVHDHNLVATTGNYIYPNGMFTTIMIAP